MSRDMTDDEVRAFLSHGTRTAKLGTLMRDGSPHVIPVWFVLDGDDVIFTTGANTVKGRHILNDGRVSLSVDEQAPPYAFVHVRGRAVGTDNPPEALEWATKIAARYMGELQAEEYGRRNAVPGELLVRLTPERIIGEDNVAGW
jgi:PPOX class probable F420-dependent enzyme